MSLLRAVPFLLLAASATAATVTITNPDAAPATVSIGGNEFPRQLNVPGVGSNLRLSGAAVMDRNFVPFYTAALYVPTSVRSVEQLLSGLSPCRITLVWQIPALDEAHVDEYWRKTFAEAAGADRLARVKGGLERLVDAFKDARHGQVVLFDYIPDAGMRIFIDDKPAGQLPGVEFNRALLSVWLGEKAPRTFREALLSGIGAE